MENLVPIDDISQIKLHLNSSQIITNSYQLYNGLSGYQDYGIIGYKIKQNIINAWRNIFLNQDTNIHEVETSIVMPHNILKASGHVDNFIDYVIHDKEGKCYRADHLVKNHVEFNGNADEMKPEELEKYIKQNNIIDVNPEEKVIRKSLMLDVDSNNTSYLRPEIAQGIFVNMKHYLDYFGNKLPFGISQVGKSFRREISPEPFSRLREFTQAEIEYFFDPLNDNHSSFTEIENYPIPLLSEKDQLTGLNMIECMKIGEAVRNGIICNQIMGYILGKIYEFVKYIGIDLSKIRFRQHISNEMAHYALQCWDLECLIGNKWLECVGCAHRGSHDLSSHNIDNIFNMKRNSYTVKIDKKINIKEMMKTNMNMQEIQEILRDINDGDNIDNIIERYNISKDCIICTETKIWDTFIPNVIEPSIGIDRICYALFVHNLYKRLDNSNKIVLKLDNKIAPYDIAVFQLSNKSELNEIVKSIIFDLSKKGLKCYTQHSSINIGKKYIRADEIGIPKCITVDFKTQEDKSVTIRYRDMMNQIRIKINDLENYINANT